MTLQSEMPPGYEPTPGNAICKCPYGRRDSAGTNWCCGGINQAALARPPTDTELAEGVRIASIALNEAIGRANEAGLEVTVDATTIMIFNGIAKVRVTPTVVRPL